MATHRGTPAHAAPRTRRVPATAAPGGAHGQYLRGFPRRLGADGTRSGPGGTAISAARRAYRSTLPTAPATAALDRRAQVAAFYAAHAEGLRRIVTRHARANEPTIEDACQHAWASLLDRDDVELGRRGLAWLATVAIRETWRLASTHREIPMGTMHHEAGCAGELPELPTAEPEPDERAIDRSAHAERVADLRALKCRERRELFLQAVGYRYEEIAAITGSTYTAVNRRIAEGRAELRRLERHRRTGARRSPPARTVAHRAHRGA
jgi:DNA-directed RNA polymerase specialized sigma24 family protein